MESIPFIFPIEPPDSQYLPLKTTKIKCEIDFHVFNKDDYESLLDVLKMDYQNVIRELINSNGMPDRWLDFRLPNTDKNEYVIYKILIKNGFKEIKSYGKHFIYGHHFLLIFSLQENDIKYNYKQIKERLEAFVKTTNRQFSLPRLSKQQSQTVYTFPVKLITNFNQEYQITFDQIQPIITETLKQQPSHLISIIGNKERSTKSKKILIHAIQILTTLFKVKTVIETKFPICAISDKNQHRILSAKMSTYSISKLTNRLSNSIKNRNLNKVSTYITSIYSNILIIQKRMKEKFEKYFDKIRKFPKLDFGDELLRNLKIVNQILKWNLVIFNNKWFFKWNESTKAKISTYLDSGNNLFGIIVTAKNFPPETFYSHFFWGNLFWAIKDDENYAIERKSYNSDSIVDDGTNSDVNSEPLLYFNNNEQNFGIISSNFLTNNISSITRHISSGLLIDTCQCGSDKIRYWICDSCHCLISRLSNDRIICLCKKQELIDTKKWCFQCSSLNQQNISSQEQAKKISSTISTSFIESKLDSTSMPQSIASNNVLKQESISIQPSTISSTNITKILIVQIKREQISNGNSSTFSTNIPTKPESIVSGTTKTETSMVTLALPESDDDLSDN